MPISTPEKALIDCLDRPDLSGGPSELARMAYNALDAVDSQELLATATAMKSKTVMQRLGFLADLVGRPDDVRHALRDAVPKSYRSHFGREERRDGDVGYVAAWGLHVNARRGQTSASRDGSYVVARAANQIDDFC